MQRNSRIVQRALSFGCGVGVVHLSEVDEEPVDEQGRLALRQERDEDIVFGGRTKTVIIGDRGWKV